MHCFSVKMYEIRALDAKNIFHELFENPTCALPIFKIFCTRISVPFNCVFHRPFEVSLSNIQNGYWVWELYIQTYSKK